MPHGAGLFVHRVPIYTLAVIASGARQSRPYEIATPPEADCDDKGEHTPQLLVFLLIPYFSFYLFYEQEPYPEEFQPHEDE